MNITKKLIESEFNEAELAFDFCWTTLTDMHIMLNRSTPTQNQIIGLIQFQDRLATTIFRLHRIRDHIIVEEKRVIKNKPNYKIDWFVKRLRLLSKFKSGIDIVVNIAKALGDAYAFFFYQMDLELLADHYSHEKVVNKSAGFGERGELEFIKQVKHINGNFALFHGITNILRHGDFSFIDIKTLRVTQIGELKTKQSNDNTLDLNLTILKRQTNQTRTSPIIDRDLEKTRKGRQILGIANLLNPQMVENSKRIALTNNHYADYVQSLIIETKRGSNKVIQVSSGLAFCCIKLNKANLYQRIFNTKIKQTNAVAEDFVKIAPKLIKLDSSCNNLILGQLLYTPDYNDNNVPGAIPLFWHPIKKDLLKQLYFGDCIVLSMFNPLYLIMELEEMGYTIDSKYASGIPNTDGQAKKILERFDLFLPYIINFLMTESFVVNSVKEIEKFPLVHQQTRITMKTQQHFDLDSLYSM